MALQNINIKKVMDTNKIKIESINDLTKSKLQDFILTLSPDEQNKLKQYIKDRKPKNTNGVFMMTRAYIYNNYFKIKEEEKSDNCFNFSTVKKEPTFADFLANL
jgi:hypothetical protein